MLARGFPVIAQHPGQFRHATEIPLKVAAYHRNNVLPDAAPGKRTQQSLCGIPRTD
jgi:hypothetical protein